MRRYVPKTIIGALVVLSLTAAFLSASRAPRFFETSSGGSSTARSQIESDASATEDSSSFTELSYERGQSSSATIYNAPNAVSQNNLLGFTQVVIGSYTYISSGTGTSCRKWDRYYTPSNYGPGEVMADLEILKASQRVTREGNKFYAQYVPDFPWAKVDVTATVEDNRVISEIVKIRYGKGTTWFLGSYKFLNYQYFIRYTHIGSSPRITLPPKKDVVNLTGSGAAIIGPVCEVPNS